MSRLHLIWYPGESDDESCPFQMPAPGWSLVLPSDPGSSGKPLLDPVALKYLMLVRDTGRFLGTARWSLGVT